MKRKSSGRSADRVASSENDTGAEKQMAIRCLITGDTDKTLHEIDAPSGNMKVILQL